MSISPEEVKKIAHLARLNLTDEDIALYVPQLSKIMGMIDQINQADTTDISPLSHALDMSQRLRSDTVTEPDLRDKFQGIAPKVEAGLYLVPKVIEEA